MTFDAWVDGCMTISHCVPSDSAHWKGKMGHSVDAWVDGSMATSCYVPTDSTHKLFNSAGWVLRGMAALDLKDVFWATGPLGEETYPGNRGSRMGHSVEIWVDGSVATSCYIPSESTCKVL